MCQPMVKGYFVIPQIQPLRDTNYSASLEPTLWRHILHFQQLQPSADICYIFYQQNQPSVVITYKDDVFSVSYLHKHPFYLYAIKASFKSHFRLYDHWLLYIIHKKQMMSYDYSLGMKEDATSHWLRYIYLPSRFVWGKIKFYIISSQNGREIRSFFLFSL